MIWGCSAWGDLGLGPASSAGHRRGEGVGARALTPAPRIKCGAGFSLGERGPEGGEVVRSVDDLGVFCVGRSRSGPRVKRGASEGRGGWCEGPHPSPPHQVRGRLLPRGEGAGGGSGGGLWMIWGCSVWGDLGLGPASPVQARGRRARGIGGRWGLGGFIRILGERVGGVSWFWQSRLG